MGSKRRYEVGLSKLATTEASVAGMQVRRQCGAWAASVTAAAIKQLLPAHCSAACTNSRMHQPQEELIALQPQLEESTRQTEAAMAVIACESAEADKVKKVVSTEEAAAACEAAKVQAIKDECEADLAEALPALQAAVRALDTLTKNDITEVKGMKSPPAGAPRCGWRVCCGRAHRAHCALLGCVRASHCSPPLQPCVHCIVCSCSRARGVGRPCASPYLHVPPLSSCSCLHHDTCALCSAAVRVVLEAVCILKGMRPVRLKDPQSGQMVDSYWEVSKKMLMDEDFLGSLR